VHWHGLKLNDFQVRAIQAVRAGQNVLVGAPTGAGKTLVAEYAIEDAVRLGRRCVYTAPIKALSNQKYRDFRDDPRVDAGLMTGDVTIHPGAQVLIMTTEILRNAIFEDPEKLADVEYAIFDEVHFLDDPERGTVWEEALIFAPPRMRIICLSATISNIGELGAWIEEIREQELAVIESRRRPVPLSHRLYSPPRGSLELAQVVAQRRRALRKGRRRAQGGRRVRRRGPTPGGPDPARLFDELQDRGDLPVLVFCFSRKDCERLARRNRHRELLSPEEARRMEALQEELVGLFQLDRRALGGEVLGLARRGVGFHHAGMLPIQKELVERMFTSGLLKLLATTETFALGINMPARTVVFYSLRKFDGISVDWLRTRDYLQMAGRAGRQGIDREGLVVSLLGPRELLEAPVQRIIEGQPEPVQSRFRMSYSTVLHLVGSLGRERLFEAWEKSLDRFQHRESGRKAQERNRRRQRAAVDARLAFLAELGYLDSDDRLTARGELARQLAGYEILLTELMFQGLLEDLPPRALAMVLVAQIHEERGRGAPTVVPQRMFGPLRRRIGRLQAQLLGREARWGVSPPLKPLDWGLTPTVLAWFEGAELGELAWRSGVGAGDLCRAFRMALQLIRQIHRALDPSWDLHYRLGRAAEGLDRDEIDARRQLELG